MKWLLIGQLLGSIVTSEHDSREACEGRAVLLREKGATARCIEPLPAFTGTYGTTISGYHRILSNLGGMPSCHPQKDSRDTQNNGENGRDPGRVTEFFEYNGRRFNKEYVQRGAVIASGFLCSILCALYSAKRASNDS